MEAEAGWESDELADENSMGDAHGMDLDGSGGTTSGSSTNAGGASAGIGERPRVRRLAGAHSSAASLGLDRDSDREAEMDGEAEAPEQERHREVAGTAGPSIDLDLGANDAHANPAVAATGSSEAIDALGDDGGASSEILNGGAREKMGVFSPHDQSSLTVDGLEGDSFDTTGEISDIDRRLNALQVGRNLERSALACVRFLP